MFLIGNNDINNLIETKNKIDVKLNVKYAICTTRIQKKKKKIKIKIGKGVHVIAIKISSQQLLQSENGD